ncbi:unnamed protein product [Mytilus coruscus]|uniref:G-protein coupled receptors family 1 profile domain-containing protein n=1 Tax=Mytilus coruscus TaxID=42192 RepID=A0A6J8B9L8_MYTCO|nr:unnamed protein product [Mytilus coruscus]
MIQQRIPVVIFVALLVIVGIIGNLHVLILFRNISDKNSTYPLFVKILAVVDLVTCLVHMPLEIVDLMAPYSWFITKGCRVFRYNQIVLLTISIAVLVLIAVERYNRICRPLTPQMTTSKAKWISSYAIIASIIFSIPMLMLNGNHMIQFDNNVTGVDCFISDKYRDSPFLLATYAMLCFGFVMSAAIIIIAYALIIRTILKRRNSVMRFDSDRITSSTVSSEMKSNSSLRLSNIPSSFKGSMKSTKTLLIISLLFVIVFLPFVILTAYISSKPSFKTNMSDHEQILYHFGIRLILINNVANPFIYGFTDNRFKRNLKILYGSCC